MYGCGSKRFSVWSDGVKERSLRWFGRVRRMQKSDYAKRVCESQTGGQGLAGRPAARWTDRAEKCLERWGVGVTVAKRECMSRGNWRPL